MLTNRPSGFTSEQVQILYLVADLLGPAISNCQLHGRLRTTYEELRTTQDQLIRNEKMRALGELASGMAHDFNNSLCGVLGFLEMTLMDRGLSSSSRGHLDLARTCASTPPRRSAASRTSPACGRQDARLPAAGPQPACPRDGRADPPQVGKPGTLAGHAHRGRGADAARASPVLGNAAELREVLTNLVFNAVDAMPQGAPLPCDLERGGRRLPGRCATPASA